MTETSREQRDGERRRSPTGRSDGEGGDALRPGAAALSEDELFEDPFDRPRESAR